MELAAVLLLGLPFWVAGIWMVVRHRRREAARRERLLARIGVPLAATGGGQQRGRQPLAQAFELRLHQAGLAGPGNRIKQWGLGGASLIGALGLVVAATFGPLAALVSAGLAAVGPLYIYIQIVARRRRFADQFPDALEAMVRSLQAGMTVDAAMRMVADDFAPPLAGEFRRMNNQVQVGVPLSSALRDFQRRIGIPEAQYFAATVIVQRETGGQLAEILGQLATIMRRRALFQGKLRAMTAESRFTAWFIGGVPVLFLAWKYLFDRPAMSFFLEDPTGQSLFRFSAVMLLIGVLLLRQMMRIRF